MADSEPGFVLHRRPYGETSLLVELFLAGSGRAGAVARGGRQPRRDQARAEPFRPLHIALVGKGELATLRRAEPADTGYRLEGEGLVLGLYLNELVMRLCPRRDPHPRTFGAYTQALVSIAKGGRDLALRRFEAVLLAELGVAPDWGRCAACGKPVVPKTVYDWRPERGVLCTTCSPAPAMEVMGRTLLYLAGEERALGSAERREARDVMRRVLAPQLGGRPLRSRALLRGGDGCSTRPQ